MSRQNKLIKWYKEKDKNNKVIEVVPGELIIEYKKAKFGKNGLNAFGDIIESGVSDNNSMLKADIDEDTIEVIENDDKILYKSKLKGFVSFKNNLLTIDNKLKMAKLSRLDSAVDKDEDNNIEVYVSQKDTNKDSIGEGVHLQSEVIHITGHVGSKSVLEALNLQIDGATHKSSVQYAKDALINRHKGTLRSNTAKIKLLEGGVVHASKVDVEVALGGHIYAEDVTITQVKSYLKVYASNSITINLVSGEDNIFKINYKDIPIMTNKMKYLENEIGDLKYKLEAADRNAHTQIPYLKRQIKDIRAKQDQIRNTTLNAKITIQKPLRGLNTIVFTLESDDEIVYKTDARLYKPFFVELNEDILTLQPVNKTITIKS